MNIPRTARCGKCGRPMAQVHDLVMRKGRVVCVDTRNCKRYRRRSK
jgi:hypothetical protein